MRTLPRSLPLFVVAGSLVLSGCPRPGLAPETDTETTTTTTTTSDTDTTTSDTTTSDTTTSDTTTSQGCEPDCPPEALLLTVASPGIDAGFGVRLTSTGDALWAGSVAKQGGDPDAFVKRIAPDGSIVWSHEEPTGPGFQAAHQVVESGTRLFAGGIGVFGGADLDGFVLRLTSGGLHDGLATIASPGGDSASVLAPVAGAGGGVFVAGAVGGTADVPEGGGATFGDADDLFVMRIREDGFVPWNMVCAGAAKASIPHALDHDEAHATLRLGLTLMGQLALPYAPPDDPMELKPPAGDPSDGLVLLVDTTKSSAAPVTGHLLFRSAGADTVEALAPAEPDGSFYVAGSYTGLDLKLNAVAFLSGDPDGKSEGFVARVSPDGSWKWVQRFGGSGNQRIVALALGADGLHVGGTLDATGTLGDTMIPWTAGVDFVVARLDRETGEVLGASASSGAGDEWVAGLAVEPGGALWISGDHSGALSFAGKTGSANGDFDAFLFRLTP